MQRGSFESHFDDLVARFPANEKPPDPAKPTRRSPKLQEKIDIHALLFARAWALDR
jgi:hypothetical protein